MLQSRRKHLIALFPIDVFHNKIGYPSFPLPSFYEYWQKEPQTIRYFDAVRCAKASPSARRVTKTSAAGRLRDICSHNDISLKHLLKSNVT